MKNWKVNWKRIWQANIISWDRKSTYYKLRNDRRFNHDLDNWKVCIH